MKKKPSPCTCEAYAFPHRFDPRGYCKDFLVVDKDEAAEYYDDSEERRLDARDRARDMNAAW